MGGDFMGGGSPRQAVGDLIANTYRIEAEISRGGMGAVFRCRHEVLGDDVAVKMVLEEHLGDEHALALFQREAAALKAVRHPAVVGYQATLRDESGALYLVMDFVQGSSLGALLKEGRRLSPEGVAILGARLAEGLSAAHGVGVAHRDISPENIVLPDEDINRATIIDFGISKQIHAPDQTIIGDRFAGRVRYASPEQLGHFGRAVDERTDVYSLGLVLAEAAGLQLDVMTGDMADAMRLRQRDASFPAGVDPDLERRLSGMLIADPRNRSRDIVAAWSGETSPRASTMDVSPQTVVETEDPSVSRDTYDPRPKARPPRKRSSVGLLAAAALILLMVIGGGGYYWWLTEKRVALSEADEARETFEAAEDPYAEALRLAKSVDESDQNEALRLFMRLFSDGDGRAAIQIARMYDPATFTEEGSPMTAADSGKARLWYDRAVKLGVKEAETRLRALR